jgi:hypothetical protein
MPYYTADSCTGSIKMGLAGSHVNLVGSGMAPLRRRILPCITIELRTCTLAGT